MIADPTLDPVPISLLHAQVCHPPGEEALSPDFFGKRPGLDGIRRPEALSDLDAIPG
jgi:hypothetical protein